MNSIEPAFAWILSATLRASVLALVVLGVQFLLRNRLSAAWRHALWLPMLAVLVLPVLPEASFGLFPPSAAKPATVVESVGVADAILEVTEMAPQGILLRSEPAAAAAAPIVPVKVNGFAVLWFAGAIGMLVAGLIGYRRNLRRIRKAATAPDPMLQAAIDEAALRAGLKHAPQTLISPAVTSPAVTGFVRPLLLLPTGFPDGFNATETRLILLHEFSHLKRLDLPLNWLICLLQSLHWFNPLLWFAFARMRADREAACDARVLSMDAADHRAAYGGALLKLQRTAPIRTPSLGFVGIFERGSELQSRIRGICAHRPKHRAWQATGAGILALLMLFGVTKGQQPRPAPAEVDPALPVNEAARGIILKKLDSIIIPRLDFQDTTVEEAIDFLRLRSAELDTTETDPTRKGVNFVIVPPRPGPEGAAAKRLTIAELKLRNVPLGRAIQYICELTHLQYKVDDTAVILGAKEAANAQPAEAKDSPAKEAIQKKLDSIIIPSIDFQDISLGEAIHFLRLRSIELDPEETGLNFVLRLPRPASGEPAAMPRIKELKLKNVPLAAALQQICELTNHGYSVDENAVTLSPKKEDGATGKTTGELEKAIAAQEAKVEELRGVLDTIVRTSDTIFPAPPTKALEEHKMMLEDSIQKLRGLKDDALYEFAATLNVPDNLSRLVYPEYLAAERQLEDEKAKGLGVNHPTVTAGIQNLEQMKLALDDSIEDCLETLQVQLELASNRLKRVHEMAKDERRVIFPGPVAHPDYVDAKRAFDHAVKVLKELEFKLQAR